jgi:hypothetical protein
MMYMPRVTVNRRLESGRVPDTPLPPAIPASFWGVNKTFPTNLTFLHGSSQMLC